MVAAKTCVPSDLHCYIYQYLIDNDLTKTAKYFKKETGTEHATPAGPNLVQIFDSYFSNQNVSKEAAPKTDEKCNDDNSIENKDQVTEGKKRKKNKRKLEEQEEDLETKKKTKIEKQESLDESKSKEKKKNKKG